MTMMTHRFIRNRVLILMGVDALQKSLQTLAYGVPGKNHVSDTVIAEHPGGHRLAVLTNSVFLNILD